MKAIIAGILPETIKGFLRPRRQRTRRGGQHSLLAIGTFDGFDVAFRKGTADELVIADSFDHDMFFPGVPEYRPAEGDTIIDVGAHIGTFSLLAASKVGSGKVYAVEACEESFKLLRVNADLNRRASISSHHLALADKEGTCTLYHDAGNWGHTTVARPTGSSETVEACTLATFFERNGIEECNFLKLNCEGSEFPILLSAPVSVLKRIGAMLVLYHCDLWGRNTEADLVSHLEASGFACAIRNQTAHRGWIIATRPYPAARLAG